MGKIIGKQQKAYSRDRNIGSILLNLLNMMDFVNKKKMESLILLVDFKKAFDSIDTKFIDSALATFNFGPSFRRWVKLFFSGRQTYLLLHGYLGESIRPEQGVPQGNVLSPNIFNICLEILHLKIEHSIASVSIHIALYFVAASLCPVKNSGFVANRSKKFKKLKMQIWKRPKN